MYDDFKLKKPFGLHGLCKINSARLVRAKIGVVVAVTAELAGVSPAPVFRFQTNNVFLFRSLINIEYNWIHLH